MIAIVGYDTCRSQALCSALAAVGATAAVARGIADLDCAARLILPDFDSLGPALRSLRDQGFIRPILRAAAGGRFILGIGGGAHLLLDVIHDDSQHTGLGLIHGKAAPLDHGDHPAKRGHRLPHRGWNQVSWRSENVLTAGRSAEESYYFDHTLHAEPLDSREVDACSNHGIDFCSAFSRGRVIGLQFRPEESEDAGRRLLARFVEIT